MNKSRLIITSLVGTIALGALSLSMSLAWYASGDRLSVSAVDMEIGGQNIRVSTSKDLSTFKNELDLNSDELENEGQHFLLKPASSMYRDDWFNEEATKPIFYDSSLTENFGDDSKTVLEEGFYQKTLYLLTETNYYVGLDVEQSLFENDEAANLLRARQFYASEENKNLQLSVDEINDALNKLVNCLRVSIFVNDIEGDINDRLYIINPTKKDDEKTYLGGLLDNDNDGYFDTYPDFDENNEVVQKEVVYGEVNDRELISYADPIDPNADDKIDNQPKHFLGNSFSGKSKKSAYTFDKEASFANGLEFKEEGALSLDELDKIVIPCYKNEPREIVVSIYLEGWDLDCINATMGASFNTKLSFKLLGGII